MNPVLVDTNMLGEIMRIRPDPELVPSTYRVSRAPSGNCSPAISRMA